MLPSDKGIVGAFSELGNWWAEFLVGTKEEEDGGEPTEAVAEIVAVTTGGEGEGDNSEILSFLRRVVLELNSELSAEKVVSARSTSPLVATLLRYVSAMCSRTEATIDSWAFPSMSIKSCNRSRVC